MKMVINGEEPTEIVATIAEYSGRKKKQGLSKRRKKPKLLRNCYDPKNFVHPEIMFEAFKSQDGGLSLQLHLTLTLTLIGWRPISSTTPRQAKPANDGKV